MNDDSDDKRRAAPRLERSVISITVMCSLVGGALWLGFWTRDREADREQAVLSKIAAVQEVFSQRASEQAADTARAIAELRVLIERTRSEILAAVQSSGERVSLLDRQQGEMRASAMTREGFASWVFALKNKNPTMDVPAGDK